MRTESNELIEVCHNEEPYALGFACRHESEIFRKVRVEKAFIDSTYETNSLNFEIFPVVVSVVGKGLPVGYLLLEIGNGNSHFLERKKILLAVFFSL